MPATVFLDKVKRIRRGQLWRHNVAGDLPHDNGVINNDFLLALVKANGSSRGFTYTHHLPELGHNLAHIQRANANGFTVNLSANNPEQAIEYKSFGVPVCLVLPHTTTENFKIDGVQVVICPATKKGKQITCADCQLCQKMGRNCIVGFPSHGISKKRVDKLVQ